MSEYENKIIVAIQYIQDHLHRPLGWGEVCKECGISEYHFHRIFSTFMNESPGNFIQRKRLERAVMLLVYSPTKVELVEIALQCGYSSQANFSKAFKSYFGVTPGAVQKADMDKNSKMGKIKSKYGKDFSVRDLYPESELNNSTQQHFKEVFMNVKIMEIPTRKVIYAQSPQGYKESSIYQTWKELIEDTIGFLGLDSKEMEKLGIGHDNPQVTPEDKCRYDACIVINSDEKTGNKYKVKEIPGGKYACFYYNGPTKDLLQFYLNIYKNWFPESGHEPGNHPLVEKYLTVEPGSPNIELETQFLLR